MKFAVRCGACVATAAAVLMGAATLAAWAGGTSFGGDDDDNTAEEGPSYFGFVRDTNGGTVPDAKVTVGLKGRLDYVTRTDLLGTYKVPGFGTAVDPNEVEVSCDKDGYKQVRSARRSSRSTAPNIPIETECVLQKL